MGDFDKTDYTTPRNLTPIDETRQQFLCKSAYQRLNLSLLKEEKVFIDNFPLAGKQLLSNFISVSPVLPIYVKKKKLQGETSKKLYSLYLHISV